MKKNLRIFSLILGLLIFLSPMGSFAKTSNNFDDAGRAKNVIMLIPDGMSVEDVTFTRLVKGSPLFLDSILTGLVKTTNADTPIADSAPAGSAMATGVKSNSPYIASYPTKTGMPDSVKEDEKLARSPLATVLEAAHYQGRSTGLVVTCNFQHATPADYSAHYPNRKVYDILGMQQVYLGMDVVLGAGANYLNKDKRADKVDLISEIKRLGYEYVTTPAELKATKTNKVWGSFDDEALAYELDRDENKEPSLSEMTKVAIDKLSKNEKGFFLMVEGSKIDWAGHANEPVGVYSDILEFDKAVETAVNFAKENKDTVVVVAADHGTGGLTIGHKSLNKCYDHEPLDSFISLVRNAKLTGEGAAKLVTENRDNLQKVMKENYGIDITADELKFLKEEKNLQESIGKILSERSKITFVTHGHQGGDIGLYCYTPDHIKPIKGVINNKDIGKYIEKLLGADLSKLTKEKFSYVRDLFPDAKFNLTKKDGYRVLSIEKSGKKMDVYLNSNIFELDGAKGTLDGVAIFNGEKVYLPESTKEFLK